MYSIAYCLNMIAHYEAELHNWTKPHTWHALARISIAEWKARLERAKAKET